MALKHPFHRAFSLFMAFLTIISKARKPVAPQSELCRLGGFELKLELVRNQGDELRIRGFSFGIADRVAEQSLQSVQIASVPGYFDGVTDGLLHPVGHGQKCLDDLACTAFVKIR